MIDNATRRVPARPRLAAPPAAPRAGAALGVLPEAGPLSDAEIRPLLRAFLAARNRSPSVFVVEELGLCRGQARVDLAAVGRQIHGYEIKSDRDSLRRLAAQIDLYGLVLDRATLVVGERHVEEAVALLPSWWGVLGVCISTGGRATLRPLRAGSLNPHRDARALAELIWRDEAIELLEARGASRGVRAAPRAVVWDRVCEHYALEEIAATVRARLKARQAQREPPPSR